MSRPGLLGLILAASLPSASLRAGEVTGRVEMPAACSPTVNPAVVHLERIDGKVERAEGEGARGIFVSQRGLQFEPRVQAIRVGQRVTFTNEDDVTHNVHLLGQGAAFNDSVSRGQTVSYVADRPGVLRVVCDIHSHMRGFVVVSPTPYFAVCRPDGRFRLDDVAAGRYRLRVWHELGAGPTREFEATGDRPVSLGTLTVDSPAPVGTGLAAPVRAWSEVIDRVGVLLSEANARAATAGGVAAARKLVDDAYFEEFEGSEMEIAVLRYLGEPPAREVERHFKEIRKLAVAVGELKRPASEMAGRSRELIIALVRVGSNLDRLGITDRSKVGDLTAAQGPATTTGDLSAERKALSEAFRRVASLAASDQAIDAASAMTEAYFEAFEPIERALIARRPQDIKPLETRFNAIRGRIGQGVKGEPLVADLGALEAAVGESLDRAGAGGGFGPAFFASLITILREGVEVILLLTMLIALASKAGNPRALSAIRWGVVTAAAASLLTAVALNLLVVTSQGRAREQVEGWVLMLASGVLFYVSYWLISQSESKRWTDFLKDQVRRGVTVGGFGTLGLTAFLAVYREGAETALMYQAMVAGQGGSRAGIAGVVVGLALGLVGLALIYRVIRTTSVRLPLRSFFKVTGSVLFGMAVVFAGNGVFELQSAGVLKTTPLGWLGSGIPWLGLHPNLQALLVQGLMMGGAVVALLLLSGDRGSPSPAEARARTSEPVREHADV